MDYSQQQRVIDGTGRILDTTMTNPNTGSWVSEQQLKTWINTGMATDADLVAEVAQREAADSDLKNAITAIQKQIDNITEAEDLLRTVEYKDGENAVPANVSKNAQVDKLKGVTRVHNQQFNNASLHVASGSATISGGVVTVSGNATIDESPVFSTISGHIYLFAYSCKNGISGTTDIANFHEAGETRIHTIPASSGYQQNAFLFTSNGITDTINFRVYNYSSGTMEIKADIILTDLTLYFGGNIPSNAQTIADIQTNYPELLVPSAYGSSLVSTTYEWVRSTFKNLAQINSFTQSTSYGQTVPCNLRKGVTYTASGSSTAGTTMSLTLSDGSYQYVAIHVSGGLFADTFVPDDDVTSVTFYNPLTMTNLQIEQGSTATTFSEYHAPSTLSLPTPVTLRSAGSVAEEFDLETGEKTNPLGSYTFTGSETWSAYGAGKRTNITGVIAKIISDSVVPKAFSDILLPIVYRDAIGLGSAGISITGDSNGSVIIISDSSLATNGKTIYFELATPTTEQLTPIPDNYVKVEPNGTIETVQTQSPKVDGAMTVTYTNKVTA